MSAKSRAAPARRTASEAVMVEDADRLAALAGPHHRNLAVLESHFDVSLDAPGGQVRIRGAAEDRARARQAIEALLADIDSGFSAPSEADVQAAVRRVVQGDGLADPSAGLIKVGSKTFKAKTKAQTGYVAALADPATPLVFGVGPAGTGKTFLAVAYGAALLTTKAVDRMIITRPAVEAGEKLGYLPGDLEEKVDPYMMPIWDALQECMGKSTVEKRRENGSIEVAPVAFMRGRTLKNAFVVVDEAQNATAQQMHMVLTRLGRGSRMAVTGDTSQVDLPASQKSGLGHALTILEGVKGVAAVRFTGADVQRHALVERIVAAYAKDADGGAAR